VKRLKTGGRTKGVRNKASVAKAAEIAASGLTPLEFLLNQMRAPEPVRAKDEDAGIFVARYVGWRDRAIDAAKAAAPYVHPKLANIEHTGKGGGPIDVSLHIHDATEEAKRMARDLAKHG
jgi:hypothetical protein